MLFGITSFNMKSVSTNRTYNKNINYGNNTIKNTLLNINSNKAIPYLTSPVLLLNYKDNKAQENETKLKLINYIFDGEKENLNFGNLNIISSIELQKKALRFLPKKQILKNFSTEELKYLCEEKQNQTINAIDYLVKTIYEMRQKEMPFFEIETLLLDYKSGFESSEIKILYEKLNKILKELNYQTDNEKTKELKKEIKSRLKALDLSANVLSEVGENLYKDLLK